MTEKNTKPTTKELSDADLDKVSGGGFTLNEELLQVKDSGFDGKGNDQIRRKAPGQKTSKEGIILTQETETI